MTTLEILQGSLDKLRRDGWAQDTFGIYADNPCPTCLVGAIVWTLAPKSLIERQELLDPVDRDDDVYKLLGKLIGTTPALMGVSCWNDNLTTTFADVEALLTAAIAIAEAAQPVTEQTVAVPCEAL